MAPGHWITRAGAVEDLVANVLNMLGEDRLTFPHVGESRVKAKRPLEHWAIISNARLISELMMILINVQLLINAEFHQWSQFCLQNMTLGPNLGHLKGKKKITNFTVHHYVNPAESFGLSILVILTRRFYTLVVI